MHTLKTYIVLVFVFAFILIISVIFRNKISSFFMIKLLNLTAPTTENIEIYDKIIEYKYLTREVLSFRSEFKIKVLNQPIDHIMKLYVLILRLIALQEKSM